MKTIINRFRWYLAAIVLLVGSGIAWASADGNFDWDIDAPLVTLDNYEELLSSPFSDSSEGQNLEYLVDDDDQTFWHSDWHGNSGYDGHHYLQIKVPDGVAADTPLVMRFIRRFAPNDQTVEWSIRGTNNANFTSEESCEELLFAETPFNGQGEIVMTEPFTTNGYKYIRIYSDQQTGSGNYGSRTYWHVSELNLYTIRVLSEKESAEKELIQWTENFSNDYESFVNNAGSLPGQYTEESVENFVTAYEAASNYDWSTTTADELHLLSDNLVRTHQAVLDSKIPYTLEEGYYRIRAAMTYQNDMPTGEEDIDGNPILETQERVKYMMGNKDEGVLNGIWGTPEDYDEVTRNIRPIFKITPQQDGTFDIVNMMYGGRFMDVVRGEYVKMDPESSNLIDLEPYTMDGVTYVDLRVSTQDPDNYFYIHQNGHNSSDGYGRGRNGSLVGWCKTWSGYSVGASEWIIEPVKEAEAEAIIAQWEVDKILLDDEYKYKTLYDEASAALNAAKDNIKIPLITSADQLSSPCSDSAEGVGSHALSALVDGITGETNSNNFWHSDWHGNFTTETHHYIQVNLAESVEEEISMQFSRRNTNSGNQITKWSVYGTNEDDFEYTQADGDVLEKLAEFETPYNSDTETLSSPTFDTKGYQYLRFYCEENNRGTIFFHLSEFQLYVYRENPKSQYASMGQIAKNLDAVLTELKDQAYTAENYQRLQDAYEAFIGGFVDPSELRELLTALDGKTADIVVGTDPGFWPDNSTAQALEQTIADAKAYDEAGVYTQAQNESFIQTLQAQAEAYDNAPIKWQTGKWYRLRFGTQEEYEQYEWPMEGCEANINDGEDVVDEALFGKYVTVADLLTEDGCRHIIPVQDEDYVLNHYLFVDDDEDIENPDMSLWRFINVGDSAFAIQNKATGLFMEKKSNESYIRVGLHPVLFTQQPAGYGQNALLIKTLDGQPQNPLHIARNNNIVTTWKSWGNSDGRRGCFFIEEAEAVSENYNASDFKMPVLPGALVAGCYPIDITCKDENAKVWTVSNIEGNQVTFAPIENQTVAAGQPFILLLGSVEDYNEESDYETVSFSHGMTITATPIEKDAMRGTFIQQTIGAGYLLPSTNKLIFSRSSTQIVQDNGVWIVPGEDFDPKAAVEAIIQDKDLITNRLQAALQALAPYLLEDAIYTTNLHEQGVSLNTQGTALLGADEPDLSAMAVTTRQIKELVQKMQASVEAYQALLGTIENIQHRESVATGVSDENKAELDAALTAALAAYGAGSYTTEEALAQITALTKLADRLLTNYLVITVEQGGLLADSIYTYVSDLADVKNLRVIGPMNDNDISTFQSMTNLVEVDLAEAQIANLNSAFQNHTLLKKAVLPNNLTSIGQELFSECSALEEVTLPGSLGNISSSYIFSGLTNLKKVTLGEGITSVGYMMFINCYRLSEVSLPSTLKTIGGQAFQNCYSYGDIQLPQNLTTISYYAFCRDNTDAYIYNYQGSYYDDNGYYHEIYDTIANVCPRHLEIPSSVTSIGNNAFYNLKGLETVTLNEGLTSIGNNAFYNTSVRTATFPSTLTSVGSNIFNAGTYYTCMSLVPPSANNGCPVENPETLYVPKPVVKTYKQANGWNKFKIEGIDAMPNDIIVSRQMKLDFANATMPEGYKPNVTIQHTNVSVSSTSTPSTLGALEIHNGENFSVGSFTHQGYNHAQRNFYFYNWGSSNSQIPQYPTLLGDGTMSADNIDITMSLTDGYWNFVSVPYPVRVGDITPETEGTQWTIRYYDGAARAAGNLNNTWVNLSSNDILEPGRGYIMHGTYSRSMYNYVVFHFPALNTEDKNLIFSAANRTIQLDENQSETANNRGWNLIGNPYPAYLEIGSLNIEAPITVWNGYNGYYAYSPLDDNYVLCPGEAFFVQCPDNQGSITFPASARQSYYDVTGTTNYVKGEIRQGNGSRSVFNLFLSDGEHSDRTRVVINPEASMDYETNRDAAKFAAMDASATQLYSVAGGVQYAINERPLADGTVRLAAHFGKTGTYTFTLDTKATESVILIDELEGTTVELNGTEGYTFTAEAGTADKRFCLQFAGTADAINELAADELSGADVFTLDGKKIAGKPSITGIYLVKKNGKVRKVSVK